MMNESLQYAYSQLENNIRFEWGAHGVAVLSPISDVVIIVDVFSFSTSVAIAVARGAVVYPYRWRDETAYSYARDVQAEVADSRNANGYSLSPSSLENLPSEYRLVLPSPNGSSLTLSTGATPTIAGCFRNCKAVAEAAMALGPNIAVIAAGERWEDDSLRPCFEDIAGAGSIIQYLKGTLSPESHAAKAVFENACENLFQELKQCCSGREKLSRNKARDIELASALNVSHCVPILKNGAYQNQHYAKDICP